MEYQFGATLGSWWWSNNGEAYCYRSREIISYIFKNLSVIKVFPQILSSFITRIIKYIIILLQSRQTLILSPRTNDSFQMENSFNVKFISNYFLNVGRLGILITHIAYRFDPSFNNRSIMRVQHNLSKNKNSKQQWEH